jgi:pyruvate formate lyase activating enzyme
VETKGYIHSVETMGGVDGPGLRYVVFLQGCPFRCLFCHNPDTWKMKTGSVKTAGDILNDMFKYREFFNFSGGGVTLSGGEPLAQPEFVLSLVEKLKSEKIHVAIDTCGFVDLTDTIKKIIDQTDLFLLDIKHLNPQKHQELTGQSNTKTIDFLKYLDAQNKKVWIRIVLLPTYSTDMDYIHQMISFLKPFHTIDKVELLPYHEYGKKKWEELGYAYKLNIPEPDKQTVKKIADEFTKNGFDVITV